ncbi:hypothetical protein GCM10009844_45010 [Nocardioides koreensis]|uniref:DUF4398 domain-containing protein n=1 Tax=Nocardioides koreensis TaxID=433651 RepID=A0ABN3A994_9ACTN
MIARARWVAGVVAVLVLAGGCGDDATDDRVPQLGARLDAVDAAVASHDYDTARTAVEALEHTVQDARRDGDLDRSRAEEILGAAETLRHALPGQGPAATTPRQSPTPTEESDPDELESTPAPPPAPPGKEKKDEHDKPEKHGKGHGHDH